MPENTETVDNATQGATAEKTFTQAEMDAIIGERLNRLKAKYADYDEVKAKAARFDADEEEKKTELQKAIERAEKAEGALKAYEDKQKLAELRAEVAKEHGVSADLLRGGTKEELEAHAEQIKAYMGNSQRFPSVPDYGEAKAAAGKKTTASLFADAVNANQ